MLILRDNIISIFKDEKKKIKKYTRVYKHDCKSKRYVEYKIYKLLLITLLKKFTKKSLGKYIKKKSKKITNCLNECISKFSLECPKYKSFSIIKWYDEVLNKYDGPKHKHPKIDILDMEKQKLKEKKEKKNNKKQEKEKKKIQKKEQELVKLQECITKMKQKMEKSKQ